VADRFAELLAEIKPMLEQIVDRARSDSGAYRHMCPAA